MSPYAIQQCQPSKKTGTENKEDPPGDGNTTSTWKTAHCRLFLLVQALFFCVRVAFWVICSGHWAPYLEGMGGCTLVILVETIVVSGTLIGKRVGIDSRPGSGRHPPLGMFVAASFWCGNVRPILASSPHSRVSQCLFFSCTSASLVTVQCAHLSDHSSNVHAWLKDRLEKRHIYPHVNINPSQYVSHGSGERVGEQSSELLVEEWNLLSVVYKNAVDSRRAAWRVITSIEQKENTPRVKSSWLHTRESTSRKWKENSRRSVMAFLRSWTRTSSHRRALMSRRCCTTR